jgi:hypothetical protein
LKLATFAKAQRTADAANAKLLANRLARQAAALQTNNAKTNPNRNKFFGKCRRKAALLHRGN